MRVTSVSADWYTHNCQAARSKIINNIVMSNVLGRKKTMKLY